MRITGEDTKHRIERAALRMFVKKSVSGATIREIAQEAGISLGAMYNHYKSKEELAWVLWARHWADAGAELRRRARASKGLADRLRSMIEFIFQRFEEDWELITYVYLSRHEHLKHTGSDLPNPHLVFRMVVVEAMARREIPRQDPDLAAAMVMGTAVHAIDMKILGRIRPNLATCVDTVAGGCVRLLGG
jgi:AcrR family transcriptional regulator